MAGDDIKEAVRQRYASAALRFLDTGGGGCCGDDGCCGSGADISDDADFGIRLYDTLSSAGLPDAATLASLGCGNPTAVADLAPGETVLDLGSGGGLDVLISARRVGPTGTAYGLDMTDEMLTLARRNQAEAGIENAEFLRGEIEHIPLPDGSVDVVISNCVINLSADKPQVLREARRVLRPGGRLAVSDIVTRRAFSPAEQADMASWTDCVAGALTVDQYVTYLTEAGFRQPSVEVVNDLGGNVVSAIVRATA